MATTLDSAGNEIINGFSTNLTPAQNVAQNTGITPVPNATIQNASPITMPSTTINTPADTTAYGMLVGKQVADTNEQLALGKGEQTTTQNDLTSLYDQLTGREADTQQLSQDQNLPALQKQARDLRSTRMLQTAQYIQGVRNIDQKNVSQGERNTAQVEAQRQNAIDALLTGAQEDFVNGNIQSAQAQVKASIDLKYAPIEQKIKNKEFLLGRIDTKVAGLDAKAVQAAKDRNDQLKVDIADKKKNDETTLKRIIDASPYAPPTLLSEARQMFVDGKSEVEIAVKLGKYGGDYLGDLVKRSTLAKNEADVRKTNADYEKTVKEIKLLEQAPVITAPAGTNAYFVQNMAASAVNKESLSQTERTAVTKNLTVLDQLDSLQTNIAKQNNDGFIKGKVNNIMASIGQNADVGTINSQLQAIVPNLARGVYGEVGVLTDNDIANYRKTLPNLTMPKDQNDAVLALTLKAVQKNLKNTLETAANSKMDVSRFAPQYQEVTNKINEINDRIGVSKQEVIQYGKDNPQSQQMISDLSAQGYKPSQILKVLGVEN